MPQFDKLTFFNQVFWVVFIFFGFYIVLLKFFLPQLSSVLKIRQKKLKTSFSSVEASNFSFFSQSRILRSLQDERKFY
jgi:F0F1-type ATP synthase membrane subunit b/b'